MIRAAEAAPQLIFSHSRLVGVVISPASLEALAVSESQADPPSLATTFQELRTICDAEGYVLQFAERVDRADTFSE